METRPEDVIMQDDGAGVTAWYQHASENEWENFLQRLNFVKDLNYLINYKQNELIFLKLLIDMDGIKLCPDQYLKKKLFNFQNSFGFKKMEKSE